jgi:hypothetical protein
MGPAAMNGPGARDGQRTDSREQAKCSADRPTRARPRGCTLWSLGRLFVREITSARLVGKEHRNILVGESRVLQPAHDRRRLVD